MNKYQMARQAWDLVWRHKFIWVLGFFAALLRVVIQLLAGGSTAMSATAGMTGPEAEMAVPLTGGEWIAVLLVLANVAGFFVLLWLVTVAANNSLYYATAEVDNGRPIGLWSSLGAGVRFVPRVVGANVLIYGLLVLVAGPLLFGTFFMAAMLDEALAGSSGLALLLLSTFALGYGLLILPFLVFTQCAIVAERLRIFAAIKRAKDVFLKKPLRTFGLVILIGIYGIPVSLVAVVAGAVHPLVGFIATALVGAIFTAFQSALFALAYREWLGQRAEVLPDGVQLALA